jgi:hypothetical protein
VFSGSEQVFSGSEQVLESSKTVVENRHAKRRAFAQRERVAFI